MCGDFFETVIVYAFKIVSQERPALVPRERLEKCDVIQSNVAVAKLHSKDGMRVRYQEI